MSEQRNKKEFEELGFSDDFMFRKVMEDPILCRDVIECLLQHPVGTLTEGQTERELKYTSDGKPIRLDVYNKDDTGTVYDTEMENLNHKSVEYHQLPKRSWFYQSSIDIDFLKKGGYYKNLPDSNVLFICTFDPFGKGMGKYTFTAHCEEELSIGLKDGTRKIFYNCTYSGNDLPEDLRKLYTYISSGQAEGDLAKRIDAVVLQGRKNEMWKSQYIKEQNILYEAIEDGMEIERVNTERERKRADDAEKRADDAQKQADDAQKRADDAQKRADDAEKRIAELEALLAGK